ncbi:hypothetical protein SUDANB1_00451 [Streptomyces sp. enrichment culture]|uniref:hypothetical protein n=1 Tax=Streptomyces sp. enrichment culture TaxID=1795815 RepID=UPI003F54D1CB
MRVWVAIWTGSSAICRLVALWIAGGPLLRLVLVAVAAGFLRGWPGWDVTVPTVAFGWLVLAVALGLRLADPTTPPEPAPQASTEAADETPEQAAPPPGGITREQLVQALHEVGAPHAHTTALADHLGASTEAVREALAAAHIPTSGGVRMKGRRVAVSPGVKAADFPPLPSPGDEPAQGGVLTSNNNDNNNSRGFETVPDEERPHRTLVRWMKAAK